MGVIQQQFEKDGFVVLPRLFSAEELLVLRQATTNIFDSDATFPGDRHNIRFDWLMRYPHLARIVLKDSFVNAMKEIAGDDFVIVPDAAFMDSCYGNWHRDTGPQELLNNLFHYEPDFCLVNVAIYLQDNHEEYGGGLDVVPGSHKTRPTWWQKQKANNRRLKYILTHLTKRGLVPRSILYGRSEEYSIPSKAGDMVFFHHQCDHRATQIKKSPVPLEHRKLALFFSCSANNKHARAYVEQCRGRQDTVYLRKYTYPASFFAEIGPEKAGHFYKDELISIK